MKLHDSSVKEFIEQVMAWRGEFWHQRDFVSISMFKSICEHKLSIIKWLLPEADVTIGPSNVPDFYEVVVKGGLR